MKPSDIHLFEEHSSTLPVWWQAGGKSKTVVYLDAHLDLQQTSDEGIAKLKACKTLEEFVGLESPHHLNPASRFAFGIENFLYPAHQLGLLERLIWVAPAHIPRRYSPALVEYMQQMDGISFDELTGFKELADGVLRGNLLGLDITICDYDSLGKLDLPEDYLLDIDIDYFVDVPDDKLWVDPGLVTDAILTQLGEPRLVTISRAVSSGFTPMAFRFIGDYIHAQLAGDDTLLDYYRNIYQSIAAMSDGRLVQGQQGCQRLTESMPELAAAWYLLALSETDANTKHSLLEEAARCDPAYGFDLAREAIGLLHRKKAMQPETIQRLVKTYNTAPMTASARAEAQVALAQVLASAGASEPANKLLSLAEDDFARHEDVLLSLAVQAMEAETTDSESAQGVDAMLEEVAGGVKNATAATLYRGDLALENEDFGTAIEFYTIAHQRAPAWILPLQRLAESYRQVDPQRADEIEKEIQRRRTTLQSLINV